MCNDPCHSEHDMLHFRCFSYIPGSTSADSGEAMLNYERRRITTQVMINSFLIGPQTGGEGSQGQKELLLSELDKYYPQRTPLHQMYGIDPRQHLLRSHGYVVRFLLLTNENTTSRFTLRVEVNSRRRRPHMARSQAPSSPPSTVSGDIDLKEDSTSLLREGDATFALKEDELPCEEPLCDDGDQNDPLRTETLHLVDGVSGVVTNEQENEGRVVHMLRDIPLASQGTHSVAVVANPVDLAALSPGRHEVVCRSAIQEIVSFLDSAIERYLPPAAAYQSQDAKLLYPLIGCKLEYSNMRNSLSSIIGNRLFPRVVHEHGESQAISKTSSELDAVAQQDGPSTPSLGGGRTTRHCCCIQLPGLPLDPSAAVMLSLTTRNEYPNMEEAFEAAIDLHFPEIATAIKTMRLMSHDFQNLARIYPIVRIQVTDNEVNSNDSGRTKDQPGISLADNAQKEAPGFGAADPFYKPARFVFLVATSSSTAAAAVSSSDTFAVTTSLSRAMSELSAQVREIVKGRPQESHASMHPTIMHHTIGQNHCVDSLAILLQRLYAIILHKGTKATTVATWFLSRQDAALDHPAADGTHLARSARRVKLELLAAPACNSAANGEPLVSVEGSSSELLGVLSAYCSKVVILATSRNEELTTTLLKPLADDSPFRNKFFSPLVQLTTLFSISVENISYHQLSPHLWACQVKVTRWNELFHQERVTEEDKAMQIALPPNTDHAPTDGGVTQHNLVSIMSSSKKEALSYIAMTLRTSLLSPSLGPEVGVSAVDGKEKLEEIVQPNVLKPVVDLLLLENRLSTRLVVDGETGTWLSMQVVKHVSPRNMSPTVLFQVTRTCQILLAGKMIDALSHTLAALCVLFRFLLDRFCIPSSDASAGTSDADVSALERLVKAPLDPMNFPNAAVRLIPELGPMQRRECLIQAGVPQSGWIVSHTLAPATIATLFTEIVATSPTPSDGGIREEVQLTLKQVEELNRRSISSRGNALELPGGMLKIECRSKSKRDAAKMMYTSVVTHMLDTKRIHFNDSCAFSLMADGTPEVSQSNPAPSKCSQSTTASPFPLSIPCPPPLPSPPPPQEKRAERNGTPAAESDQACGDNQQATSSVLFTILDHMFQNTQLPKGTPFIGRPAPSPIQLHFEVSHLLGGLAVFGTPNSPRTARVCLVTVPLDASSKVTTLEMILATTVQHWVQKTPVATNPQASGVAGGAPQLNLELPGRLQFPLAQRVFARHCLMQVFGFELVAVGDADDSCDASPSASSGEDEGNKSDAARQQPFVKVLTYKPDARDPWRCSAVLVFPLSPDARRGKTPQQPKRMLLCAQSAPTKRDAQNKLYEQLCELVAPRTLWNAEEHDMSGKGSSSEMIKSMDLSLERLVEWACTMTAAATGRPRR